MVRIPGKRQSIHLLVCLFAAAVIAPCIAAQTARPVPSPEHKEITKRISGLRALPDDTKGAAITQLALDIRAFNEPGVRVGLASGLANLATEGDFGARALQEVADTLSAALKLEPVARTVTGPSGPYVTLAGLVRYEHVKAALNDPQFAEAMKKLKEDDKTREKADFTLNDLNGNAWTLKSLRGKVVLVNFWATWCPPCRKEIPDLELLYNRFKDKGLVVLGISDEAASKVTAFVGSHTMTYPVLLDPGRKVNKQLEVEGIPRTLLYNRNGRLAAEAIDMRTQRQLLALLAKAGMK